MKRWASLWVGACAAPSLSALAFGPALRMSGGGDVPNKYSSTLTQQKVQGASQAMLYATGLKPEDMNKAQVGVSSVWFEGNPCNMHLMVLAAEVKQGVQDSGMVA